MATAKKLPSGQWRALVYSHNVKVNGKQKRIYESFTAATKKEAEFMAAEFILKKENRIIPQNMTLGEAIDAYIELSAPILSKTSIASYEKIKRNYFLDLMDIPIKKITSNIVQQSINREITRPSKRYNDGTKLSAKTINNAFGLIATVLKKYNPSLVLDVKLPKKENHIKELIPPEIIFDIVKGTDIELPVLLAMWLSFSMSEIRGLTKSKSISNGYISIKEVIVDVDNKPVIKKQAKAFYRIRSLKIPTYIQNLINNTNPNEDRLVTLSGHAIYMRFKRLLEKNNLPHMTFHDLRHVNASVMAQLRIPDKYAMERGGWKTDAVMKNIYQHTFSEQRELVDKRIDEYFESKMQHEMQHE
ncbi:MAG: site-specific integrase [Candidatus Metalachnospira sp.]|nr:site-specific integrase [Candidatus Metalachnospira sp.]